MPFGGAHLGSTLIPHLLECLRFNCKTFDPPQLGQYLIYRLLQLLLVLEADLCLLGAQRRPDLLKLAEENVAHLQCFGDALPCTRIQAVVGGSRVCCMPRRSDRLYWKLTCRILLTDTKRMACIAVAAQEREEGKIKKMTHKPFHNLRTWTHAIVLKTRDSVP